MFLLVITKEPEFTENGEVVLGQCEPYTSGWKMQAVTDGGEEALLTGTYYDLRKVQRRCAGKDEKEIREIVESARRALERRVTAVIPQPMTGRAPSRVGKSTEITAPEEIQAAVAAMEDSAGTEGEKEAAWETNTNMGLLVAKPSDPGAIRDIEALGQILDRTQSRALALDLSNAERADSEMLNRIREVLVQCDARAIWLMVASAPEKLQEAALHVHLDRSIEFYPSLDGLFEAWHERVG